MSDNELGAEESAPEINSGSESATEGRPEDQAEKVHFDDAQQEKLNEIVGGVRMKSRNDKLELEQKNQALAERLTQLEAQQPAQSGPPKIPPIPDAFDENFAEKVRARDQQLIDAARWESNQEAQDLIRQEREREANIREAQSLQTKVESFNQQARAIGITEETQRQLVNRIAEAGVNQGVLEEMIESQQGARMLQGVGNLNTNDLLNFADKSNQGQRGLVDAIVDIRQLAGSPATSSSSVPRPPDMLTGTGVPAQKRGPRGLTIE